MSDRGEAEFSHIWASIEGIDDILVVREKEGIPYKKVRYYALPRILKRFSMIKSIIQLLAAVILSLTTRPDIICSVQMNPHGYYGYLISRVVRKPLILHLVSESQGGLKGFGGGDSRFSILRSRVALQAAKHASAITTTGERTKKHLIGLGIDADKVITAPSTTGSTSFFALDTPKIYDMIMVTRFHPVKRVDIFLKVLETVSEQRDVVAAIAGTGPLQASMMDLSRRLGISKRLRFLGQLSKAEINLTLNQSKVFLLTSETEGFPKVVAESLCAGTPVVSADVGDIGALLTDGKDGFLISPFDDIEHYASHVVELIADEELRERISRQGQCLCKTTLSESHRVSIFRNLLGIVSIKL